MQGQLLSNTLVKIDKRKNFQIFSQALMPYLSQKFLIAPKPTKNLTQLLRMIPHLCIVAKSPAIKMGLKFIKLFKSQV